MNYRKEHIIYTLMWVLLYVSPVTGLYIRMSSDPHLDFSWIEVFNVWKFYTVWLVAFAVHNWLLAPLLIVRRRTWLYSLLLTLLLSVAAVTIYVLRPSPEQLHRAELRHAPSAVSADGGHDSRAGHGCRDARDSRAGRVRRADGYISYRRHDGHRRPEFDPMHILGPGETVAFFGGLLLMGMNIGVKLYFKSQEDSKILVQIERQNLERQLEYLKYQVNPHFFMNTLNNIHALVDINPDRAKTSIVELSKMMRYILYEGNNRLTPLPREVQFLQNYVKLMSMRYTDRVRIRLDAPPVLPDMTLPPLLLIIFVENAFKHGVSYRTESFVDIGIAVSGGRLVFSCINSRPAPPHTAANGGGMGLRNVRRRLDLLFPGNYTLDIRPSADTYSVRLDIPLAMPAQHSSENTTHNTQRL